MYRHQSPAAIAVATAISVINTVVPKSRPISTPRITAPEIAARGRIPRRLFHSLKQRKFSEQYLATNTATAILANSDGWRLSSSPGSLNRIQRFAPLIAGKQKAAISSSRKESPIQISAPEAILR